MLALQTPDEPKPLEMCRVVSRPRPAPTGRIEQSLLDVIPYRALSYASVGSKFGDIAHSGFGSHGGIMTV